MTPSVDPCPKEFRNCPMDTRLPISLFICKCITVCIIVINCVYWKVTFKSKVLPRSLMMSSSLSYLLGNPNYLVQWYSHISSIAPPPSHAVFAWRGTTRFTGSGRVGNWHRQMVPGSQTSFSCFFRVTKNSAAGLADEQVWASIFQLHPSRQQP